MSKNGAKVDGSEVPTEVPSQVPVAPTGEEKGAQNETKEEKKWYQYLDFSKSDTISQFLNQNFIIYSDFLMTALTAY